jgi:Arc/MetJ-type ribon-helix-helix transcriptional regulator
MKLSLTLSSGAVMQVTIPKETAQFLKSEVTAGHVESTDDAVMQGIELYQLRQQYIEDRIQQGIEDVEAGRTSPSNQAFMDDIKRGALRKIAAKNSQK